MKTELKLIGGSLLLPSAVAGASILIPFSAPIVVPIVMASTCSVLLGSIVSIQYKSIKKIIKSLN